MKKILLICLVAITLCLTVAGCGKKESKNPLVGKWAYGSGSTFVFTFNEDNTCHYTGNNLNCTYTLDGENISILYDGMTEPYKTTYKIEDNKFIMKDSQGKDVVYNKQ